MNGTRVLIGRNAARSGSAELSARIASLLREGGFVPCVCGEDALSSDFIGAEIVESPGICGFVVTVGGDGTILKWGKIAAEFDLPLIGVNMGRLGFMASLEPEDAPEIPKILSGEFRISPRMLLYCSVYRDGAKIFSERVLNDVILSRESGSKLPEFAVSCGEIEVTRVRADGVILSTPMGSTAYSLSAGGPILAPDLECVEFTALCPHTLFNRPMIFSDKQIITVNVNHYHDSKATFSVDGGAAIPFRNGDTLRLRRSGRTLRLIETGDGFYGAVHNKLMAPIK